MARKWIAITLSNGQTRLNSFDDSEIAEFVFLPSAEITKIVISDQPENPSVREFIENMGNPS